ncbi:MAG: GGDEF domain-containing protein [Thermodesulfobacteriota bacterium]
MKIQGKIILSRFFVNSVLASALVLNGILVFSFSASSPVSLPQQNMFQLLVLNSVLIFTGLSLINLFGGRYCLQMMAAKQNEEKLTGCMTRYSFTPLYERMLQESKVSQEPFTLLMVNIDHFETINNSHGHLLGDDILSLLGETVRSVFRTADISCRWGGDQILVALKNCEVVSASQLAEKLLAEIRRLEVVCGEESVTFTSSVGIAQMIKEDTPESLVARAETGLYSACDAGHDTYDVGYDWIVIEYYCEPIC